MFRRRGRSVSSGGPVFGLIFVRRGWFSETAKMIVHEFRIPMPLTVEEYHIGQLYTVAKLSLEETGGGEGVEVVLNEPFEDVPLLGGQFTNGQYTKKIYYLQSKLPWWLRKVAPKKSLIAIEEAWNAYPYCKTVAKSQNHDYEVTVESMHLPDPGTTQNALELPDDLLAKRHVEFIDIAGPAVSKKDYKKESDPHLFHSKMTNRGPLRAGWAKSHRPIMCCYKVIKIQVFGWGLIRNRIQNYLLKAYPRLFQRLHRYLFCFIDDWHNMTMEQIRELEEEAHLKLDVQRKSKGIRGTAGLDDEH